MKRSLLLMLALLMLIAPISAMAQEPPLGSAEDNACNAGGVMEGKCDTPWEWICGYYLARWTTNGGWFTPNNFFPDWCASLLPPRPVSLAEAAEGQLLTVCDYTDVFTIPHGLISNERCVDSSGFGYDDWFRDGSYEYIYLFGEFGGVCPATPAGYTFFSGPIATAVTIFGFSPWDTLGLGSEGCTYEL